ncbi:PREDICTED: uncharacterized protein LOC105559941 isoform X2 [Vollenhovia emeryi]|uniref:uncharacterized protein LOC105559941 isoform X2 n=1 Tax=Vollenhovia emeryi TaxID=411798 RepID=UPI0005F53EA3|nr:PREDICTED: uncharacterized protein LOC105559941 isoform X2 [Vollenhovia emeryi]
MVVPGSGINNKVPDSTETSNDSVCDVQVHATDVKTEIVAQNTSILNNTQATSLSNVTRDMTFYSMISDTAEERSEGDTNSKITDDNFTESNVTDSIIPSAKRKRVRKRKSKSQPRLILSPFNTTEKNASNELKSKKLKITSSYTLPPEKHIRFVNTEDDEDNIAKQIVQEVSKDSHSSNVSPSKDLSTLLALGQSSTPITFVNKKLKSSIATENVSSDEVTNTDSIKKAENVITNICRMEGLKITERYKSLCAELEKIPAMTRKPQIKDFIAFKTLKLGANYTPQMSSFIFTEVIDYSAESGNYNLRIFFGREEIAKEVPSGKFSVTQEESFIGDTFVINYSQMMELRLIS